MPRNAATAISAAALPQRITLRLKRADASSRPIVARPALRLPLLRRVRGYRRGVARHPGGDAPLRAELPQLEEEEPAVGLVAALRQQRDLEERIALVRDVHLHRRARELVRERDHRDVPGH